jgi:AbrB family looped-hinge helix DNA binding protein
MTTLTITAKGQITLKKELLRHLGLGPGDTVDVTPAPDGHLSIRPTPQGRRTIEDSIGALKRPGQKPLSIEEMNDVIARSWAGER